MKARILLLNRRDIRNPLSGGAEIYTHEIFKQLADQYEITHYSSSFTGAGLTCNIPEPCLLYNERAVN